VGFEEKTSMRNPKKCLMGGAVFAAFLLHNKR
jgi:hypothetical protein